MSTKYAIAPTPPTGPGMVPGDDQAVDHYLPELGRWRLHREHELQALDALTQTHAHRTGLNEDITTSMSLWHAIAQRHDLLMATGQDTRAGRGEREWVARLMWGVRELPDGDARALAIPMPEAARLSDALTASLRARVQADTDGMSAEQRITALEVDTTRMPIEVDDSLDGAGAPLAERLSLIEDEVRQQAGRADDADVLQAVGDAESQLAVVERDLIVAETTSTHRRVDADQVRFQRDHLIARGEAVRSLAQRVVNSVRATPRLGTPDVIALGDVPTDEAELVAYMGNLERVGRALDQAHTTYAAALDEYGHLSDRAVRLAQTLAGCGAPTSVGLAGMLTSTAESLHNQAADMQRASALVAAHEAYLGQLRPDA